MSSRAFAKRGGRGRLWALPLAAAIVGVTSVTSLALPMAPPPHQQLRVPGGETRVTLRLRHLDLPSALRLIAARQHLSFAISPDVRGQVDSDFFDERLDRVLEILVTTNNIHMRRVGDTFVFSSSPAAGLAGVRVVPLNYASATELSKILIGALRASGLGRAGAGAGVGGVATRLEDLVTPDPRSNSLVISGNAYVQEQVEKLVARLDRPHEHQLFRLNYIQAEEAAKLLTESLFAGAQNTGVKFLPVARENALMVVASGEDLRLVKQVLDNIDRRMRQVLIEVKLVELAGTANQLLGVTFDSSSGTVAGAWSPTTGLDVSYNPLQETLTQLRVKINALMRDNKARLLASPSIVAMDSKESKIEITDDIIERVLIETTVNANNIFTRQNVTLGTAGVTLAIQPKINPDGFITMKVDPTISFIRETVRGATNAEILATLKSQRKLLTPEVRVRDGETLLIGGLNQERTTETADKIPFLGDLPLIGAAFRRTDVQRTVTELVVMITPKLVPDSPVAKAPAGGPVSGVKGPSLQ
ncbi:MAG: secretin N-terminal domain-containing protein [Candidatus Sericytochromatia bacterium]|nr:secretin N-terminal domain-containing protein [Candidatus Sericytochromatia bacterium]